MFSTIDHCEDKTKECPTSPSYFMYNSEEEETSEGHERRANRPSPPQCVPSPSPPMISSNLLSHVPTISYLLPSYDPSWNTLFQQQQQQINEHKILLSQLLLHQQNHSSDSPCSFPDNPANLSNFPPNSNNNNNNNNNIQNQQPVPSPVEEEKARKELITFHCFKQLSSNWELYHACVAFIEKYDKTKGLIENLRKTTEENNKAKKSNNSFFVDNISSPLSSTSSISSPNSPISPISPCTPATPSTQPLSPSPPPSPSPSPPLRVISVTPSPAKR